MPSLKKYANIASDNSAIIALYSLAHFWILLIPQALFWDDWILYETSPKDLVSTFSQAGFVPTAYLHISLLSLGPWIYKVLTFLLYLGTGLSLKKILERHIFLNKEDIQVIVILFLLVPFNWARIALIDFPYALCNFLFFYAWSIMSEKRFLSNLLFFISFSTPSLLFFLIIPFLDSYYLRSTQNNQSMNLRTLSVFCYKNINFILIPFIWFGIKTTFFAPYGIYEGYNEGFELKNLIFTPLYQLKEFCFDLSINISFLLFWFVVSLRISKKIFAKEHVQNFNFKIIIIGILTIIAGAFPYWIIGAQPLFYGWASRHQLLLPLGTSLILYALYKSVTTKVEKIYMVSIILSICLGLSSYNYLSLISDWSKKTQLIELFSKNELVKNSEAIIIIDNTYPNKNIVGPYRFYEWNGITRIAFNGEEKRLCIPESQLKEFQNGAFNFLEDDESRRVYKCGAFRWGESVNTIRLSIETEKLDRITEIKRLWKPLYKIDAVKINDILIPNI